MAPHGRRSGKHHSSTDSDTHEDGLHESLPVERMLDQVMELYEVHRHELTRVYNELRVVDASGGNGRCIHHTERASSRRSSHRSEEHVCLPRWRLEELLTSMGRILRDGVLRFDHESPRVERHHHRVATPVEKAHHKAPPPPSASPTSSAMTTPAEPAEEELPPQEHTFFSDEEELHTPSAHHDDEQRWDASWQEESLYDVVSHPLISTEEAAAVRAGSRDPPRYVDPRHDVQEEVMEEEEEEMMAPSEPSTHSFLQPVHNHVEPVTVAEEEEAPPPPPRRTAVEEDRRRPVSVQTVSDPYVPPENTAQPPPANKGGRRVGVPLTSWPLPDDAARHPPSTPLAKHYNEARQRSHSRSMMSGERTYQY